MCLAALWAACIQEETFEPVPVGTNRWVTFVSVPDAATTRVTADSRWQVDDRIGIYMVEAGKKLTLETIVNETANRQYRVESIQGGQAVFVPATANDTIFIATRKYVNFIAYYPYNQAIDEDFNFTITNLEKQGIAPPPDLLFSNMKEVYGSGTFPKNVSLLFHHQMAKVKFNINRTLTTPSPAIMNSIMVEIKNVWITSLYFNLADGTMGVDGAANNTTLYTNVSVKPAGNVVAEALLIPAGNAEQISAVIKMNNGIYQYVIPFGDSEDSLSAATTYNYEVLLGEPLPIDWVFINAGTFLMGSPPDEPDRKPDETLHQVTLTKDFKMSKYEITNAQYAYFMNNKKIGYDAKDNVDGFGSQTLIDTANSKLKWVDSQWKAEAGSEDHPMTYVSWYGAKAFADWMGCSLPTEAQMEYAIRAGAQTAYFFGKDANDIDKYAWHMSNSGGGTHPVGQKLTNPWGLHDIVGNVHEYCVDWYQENLGTQPVVDPVGATPSPNNWKSHRGGSFTDWYRRYQRSAARSGSNPNRSFWNVGFRIVYVLP
jgi:formylglycine-generating enzyme required for sulfatase activity